MLALPRRAQFMAAAAIAVLQVVPSRTP
jgi:hypothetical protein